MSERADAESVDCDDGAMPMAAAPPVPTADELTGWCGTHFRAGIARELFRVSHLSTVVGVELADGRQVAIKIRRPEERLAGCHQVHAAVFERGFPCPEPLVAPVALGPWAISAEVLVAGGTALPPTGRAPRPFAEALAWLAVAAPAPGELAATLDPKPPWNAWDHADSGLWPPADDCDHDLNVAGGPDWIDAAAEAACRRLGRATGPFVVGHGDWYTGNLRWSGDRLHVVHDWDSIIVEREPAVVGFAAAIYATEQAGTDPTTDESSTFLAAYEEARGVQFTDDERADAWAASLWLRAFDAKKQVAKGEPLQSLTEAEAAGRRARFE